MNLQKVFKAIASVFILSVYTLTSLNAQVKGVKDQNNKWGLVDANGKVITESIYDNMGKFGEFSEGRLAVWVKNKSGYIDTSGKVVVPIIYDECNEFIADCGTVWLAGKCGLVDKKGKLVIPCKYFLLSNLDQNLWRSSSSTFKQGLVSRSGKELLPTIYDMIERPSYGYGMLALNKKVGYYNKDGKITIPCKYDEATNFSEGVAAVALKGKWGFIDVSGRLLSPMEYESKPSSRSTIMKNGRVVPYIKPTLMPPLTAKDLISNYINQIGGRQSLADFKNYQFTLEEFNYKNILYTTTMVYHADENIHADIYDNTSEKSKKIIMTAGEMWLAENGEVKREDSETDYTFLYSLPSLLVNAEKMGYTIKYDPKRCQDRQKIFITVVGKEKRPSEYTFYFNDDYSINEIEVSRFDNSYFLGNIETKYINGIFVISSWSSAAAGKDLLIWMKRKDFKINASLNPKLFLKP